MKIDLTGRTALVTGSTDGIGYAVAKQLAGAGAHVVINGRGQEKVDAAVAKIGGSARGVAADLVDAAGAETLFAVVPNADIVVSNAGVFQPSDFFDTDDETWERHWQVNVMAGVRLARHYLPGMKRNGWGRFILIGSESAFNIPVQMIHYGVSKTADVALARGLAKRMAGTGVTVNAVLPGPTLSEGVAAMLKDQLKPGQSLEDAGAAFVKANRPSSIIGRVASTEEVANMIVYVASAQSSATTGAALRVDGGVIDTLM